MSIERDTFGTVLLFPKTRSLKVTRKGKPTDVGAMPDSDWDIDEITFDNSGSALAEISDELFEQFLYNVKLQYAIEDRSDEDYGKFCKKARELRKG